MTLRTVFMGTPEIAVPALRQLAKQTQVTLVITQPDRPAGRGMKLTPPPVKVAALELGIPVWQPETMRGAESDPRLTGHDLFVVMAYGEILRQPVLSLPKACINLHASLLPRWRGASPLQACLRAGDTETGVCVMEMVPALDAGPVYVTERIPLTPMSTLPELHDLVATTAASALQRFLIGWPGMHAISQNESQVTICRKLVSAHGQINWNHPAVEIERHVRAYTPAPGCWTTFGAERIRILGVRIISDNHGLSPCETRIIDDRLVVGTGCHSIEILTLQAPSKTPMSTRDYLRGNKQTIPPRLPHSA
jgi:methionyl-tRNA formyltransferase